MTIVDVDGLSFVVHTWDEGISRNVAVDKRRPEFRRLDDAMRHLADHEWSVDGKTLLDIGANIGTTCLRAVARYGFSRAIAVEPEPRNSRALRAAAALNDIDITVVEAAAGAEPGQARLETHSNSGGHHVGDFGTPVRLVPADSLADPSEVGLVWIDVERFEREVLAGAPALLAAGVPLVIEVKRSHIAAIRDQIAAVSLEREIADLRPTGGESKLTDILILPPRQSA